MAGYIASAKADVDTVLARLTAARAGYLENLSAGAVALASVCTEARLAELAAANLPTDIDAILARRVPFLDFWSEVEDTISVPITASVADLTFPSVVVADLPSGLTVVRVIAMLKVGVIHDTSSAANYIEVASKYLRIMKANGTAWETDDVPAINFTASQWYTAADAWRGGDVMVGTVDLAGAPVDGNGTYEFQSRQTGRTDAISAKGGDLVLYDIQCGLRVYFR